MQPIIEAWVGDGDLEGVWLKEADGSGAVVAIRVGLPLEDQTAELADRVQDWAVEALNSAGLSAVWPQCPYHPASHPLQATIVDREPTWICPRDEYIVATVGDFAGDGHGGSR